MTLQLCGLLIIIVLVICLIAMARKNGKQAARLKELKRELNAISRAQELEAAVSTLSPDDARRRLLDIANEQRSRMQDNKF